MWTVYLIESASNGRYYTGHTNDLQRRLVEHNQGQTRSTRPGRPWKLVYTEEFQTKQEAAAREFQIKTWKPRRTIEERLLKR